MAEETQNAENTLEEAKTFTQAELDEIVKKRVAKEKSKFADYDKYKADSEELLKLKEANKTELEKAKDKAAKAEAERDALVAEKNILNWKSAASKKYGVPIDIIEGSSEESINAHAEKLAKYLKNDAAPIVHSDGKKPKNEGMSNAELFGQALEKMM